MGRNYTPTVCLCTVLQTPRDPHPHPIISQRVKERQKYSKRVECLEDISNTAGAAWPLREEMQ